MISDGIRERFEFYRKWFQTFLIKEFLNLPSKYQNQFLAMAQKFLGDCKRIYEEGKTINERTVSIEVESVISPDNKEESFIILGSVEGEKIKINYPNIKKAPPKIGSMLLHTVYSIDGIVWYSSKDELLKGRKV